jgi:2-C-methyl-D-erythritol 2,4-cyclodiphosphate synthase
MDSPNINIRCGIIRCGIGYDTHRLVEGRKLFLGGVDIPATRGLLGHSDGDVLSHAITDALLGAAGLGDIGQYFSDKDPQWSGANSLTFLKAIKKLLRENNFEIANIDSVVIIDQPKIAPYKTAICESLASALDIPATSINVKAKTSEGVNPDIAAAHAVALLVRRNN